MARILVISNLYPPHHYGGYELSCHDVVERWRDRGHDVHVLTGTHRRPGVADGDSRVRRELVEYVRRGQRWVPGRREVVRLERANNEATRNAIAECRPDVVSVWNMGGIGTSILTTVHRADVPMVFHVCNAWPAAGFDFDVWMRWFDARPGLSRLAELATGIPTERLDLGMAGRFCWVSEAIQRLVESKTPWTYPRSEIVPSGINTDEFPPLDEPPTARPVDGPVLYVGRFDHDKGVDVLVEALLVDPDLRVDMVGSGSYTGYDEYLRGVAEANGVSDRLTMSETDRAGVAERYRQAPCLVFTSLYEPFGLVPIEAMACGCPVVATLSGGPSEFLRPDENCVAFAPGDPEELASAIRRVLADAALRERIVRGGLETARRYTVDRLAERLEQAHLEEVARAEAG